jgi:DNA-binding HxlR family transcriptional regulator
MPRDGTGVCVVEARLAELSGRFRPEILKRLQAGPAHFAVLRRETGASAHSLTRALRVLEAAGLVSRTRATRWGPATYALTAAGEGTIVLLDRLAASATPAGAAR